MSKILSPQAPPSRANTRRSQLSFPMPTNSTKPVALELGNQSILRSSRPRHYRRMTRKPIVCKYLPVNPTDRDIYGQHSANSLVSKYLAENRYIGGGRGIPLPNRLFVRSNNWL
jgi:hypothetical protein